LVSRNDCQPSSGRGVLSEVSRPDCLKLRFSICENEAFPRAEGLEDTHREASRSPGQGGTH
jgi:hypothetical protein